MIIENYCSISNNQISFTRQQASDFAKNIADDFNPLHDINAKRFCVPGDLLFAIILTRSGLHQEMSFTFSGMVSNDISLNFPTELTDHTAITDDKDKEYLSIAVTGEKSTDKQLIDSLITAYVEFSGHTFPHILVKLMAENNVMINPARPMIMYQDMSIHLDRLDVTDIALKLAKTTLSIEGKRGQACLSFDLISEGEVIGHGIKHMLLSGLREYCPDVIETIVEEYNTKKLTYSQSINA